MTTISAPTTPQKKSQSQWAVIRRQFLRNPLARIGLILLGLLYTIALLAGFLAPYGLAEYSTTDRISWAPPTKIHWTDKIGRAHV